MGPQKQFANMNWSPPQLLDASPLLVPLLLLAGGAALALLRPGRQAAEAAAGVARLLLALLLILIPAVWLAGPARVELAAWGPARLGFLFDPLSVLLLLLVGFLGMVITRYTVNHLDGDPGQARFSRWLLACLASVLLLAAAGNLLLFAAAWMAASLCLHRLLTLQPDRPAAMLAARKKFLLGRVADGCMLAVLVLVWRDHGTWEFHELFARPATAGSGWVAGLLVAAAILKTVQFPFHSWLPETLEAPTPVSALMHAGIVNAGGFMVVRLSPLLIQAPDALGVLAVSGLVTAGFASLVMLTQTSVKRTLGWSTIAQMGFMLLQCGLGAFALAMLHLVAHSLYKAHAFLSSGGAVRSVPSADVPVATPPWKLAAALGAAAVVTFGAAWLTGLSLEPGRWPLMAVLVLALGQMLGAGWAGTARGRLLGWTLLLGGVTALVWCELHLGFERLLGGVLPAAPERGAWGPWVTAGTVALFLALMILQSALPRWADRPWVARCYVHAANGFYLGPLFARLIKSLSRFLPRFLLP